MSESKTATAFTAESTPEKDPNDWTTGDEPMTGPQASYLKTLEQQTGEGAKEGLSKAEASKRIDALREKAGLKDGSGD